MEAREKGWHPSGWVRVVVVKMSPIKKRDKRREESVGRKSRVWGGWGSLMINRARGP